MEAKKTTKADLENFIQIFRQLGLILTLFVVFLTIEHKTFERESKSLNAITTATDDNEEEIIEYEIEQIVQPPPPPPAAPEVIEIIENEEMVEETIIESTETDETERIEVEDVDFEEVEEVEEVIEDVPFAIIENVPVYPGCEKKKTNEEKKDCLNKEMQKHVAREFDINLATDLGLTQGKQRIYVQFKITSKGNIEIVGARAPHVRLEKEAKRVVNLLPKMTPGKQRGRAVNVTYMLPITFQIE